MPRSGTSFLGQLLNSSPDVTFRMEPIFSYCMKNQIDQASSKEEYLDFFQRCLAIQDDFMNQEDKRKVGSYPTFEKKTNSTLVFKTTRFHQILDNLLSKLQMDIKLIFLVRNPCGAINSWLKHPNEFPQGLDKAGQWRSGACRKTAPEEFWGFNDWLKTTAQFERISKNFPNTKIVKYETLVHNLLPEAEKIFRFLDLAITEQTKSFIRQSQDTNNADPYSVFKYKSVTADWEKELDLKIQNEIFHDLKQHKLETYL